jgi:predicted Zn finger-like uncharacterized protein
MPIHIVCPGCSASYNVPDELAGKKIRCKQCDGAIPVIAAAKVKAAAKTMSPDDRTQPSLRKPPPHGSGEPNQKTGRTDDDRPRRRSERDDDDDRPRRRSERDDDDDRHARRGSERDQESERVARRKAKAHRKSGNNAMLLIVGGIGGGLVLVGIAFLVVWLVWIREPQKENGTVNTSPPVGAPGPGFPRDGDGGGELPKPALDKVKPATVYISVREKDGGGGSGSGFLAFEPGIVLTNAHVIGMLEPGTEKPDKVEVSVNHGQQNERKFQAEIMGVDRSHDLAVLKIPAAGLPPCLEVKASQELHETQPVWICGYPLGNKVGKEVTIGPASVTALRKERGRLDRVQIQGAMRPGNSGGPVVDKEGNVVGVSVEIIVGTLINFAVPAEYVHDIYNGQLLEVGIGQSYHHADHITVPVNMELMNPAGHITKVELDVWMGDDEKDYKPPVATGQPPPPRANDTPRKRFKLSTGFNGASGDFDLPGTGKTEPGKVCFWQPVLTYKDGKVFYPMGDKYFPNNNIPVHKRPANLFYRNRPGPPRQVIMRSRYTFAAVGGEGNEGKRERTMIIDMVEHTGPLRPDGSAMVNLEVKRFNMDVTFEGKPLPDEYKREIQRIKENGVNLLFQLEVDGRGNLKSSDSGIRKGTPQDVQEDLKEMAGELEANLESISVTLPNRADVAPGEKWTGKRKMMVRGTGRGKEGLMDITYTYLGRRTRDGRDEALIEMGGLVRMKGAQAHIGGRVGGRALIDLETGMISQARSTLKLDIETSEHEAQIKLSGEMEVTIRRALPRK